MCQSNDWNAFILNSHRDCRFSEIKIFNENRVLIKEQLYPRRYNVTPIVASAFARLLFVKVKYKIDYYNLMKRRCVIDSSVIDKNVTEDCIARRK